MSAKKKSFPFQNRPEFVNRQVLVNYILSHAKGDIRPFLQVSILGVPMSGLLDSGSSVSLVSESGRRRLLALGLKMDTSRSTKVTVADGSSCESVGAIEAPVCLLGRVELLSLIVVPHLSTELILGADFWMAMDVIPDLRRDVWYFGTEPKVACCGVKDKSLLSPDQAHRLDVLLDEKFAAMGDRLGCASRLEHEIIVKSGTVPIKQRYYPVSPAKQKILDEELNKMLSQDIIEPSCSPWSSPALLVPKKGGLEYRFCVDYRALNTVTKKDAYPLPYISSILERLKGARWLSSLDIKSAYHQVAVKESSRELTAFTIPGRGLFHFKRMPFGLTNAPATWQRLVDQVLGADLEPSVFVYLDDIIIISPDFDAHLDILQKVFDRLIEAGLTVRRDKCHFGLPSLKYLGYVVDSGGLHVDIGKVEAILQIQPPRNPTEVRRFVGMASWYRRFIPNFSSILAPLTRLTHKNITFTWSEECQQAFDTIRNALVSAPVLTCPDFEKPFTLQTDASAYGLGAVLTQQSSEGEHVICFLSRSLNKAERNYSTTERECLAVIWAVEKLRHFLEGSHFTVVTDHSSLTWLLHKVKDATGKLARWALRLQPYDFSIVHRKGRENVVPDFLSRSVPIVNSVHVSSPVDTFSSTKDTWYLNLLRKVEARPEKYPQWRIENGLLLKYVRCTYPALSIEQDYWKLVVPKDHRARVIKDHHDPPSSGHLGSYKTYWRLHRRFTWPKMHADVNRYVRSCHVCAQQKPEQKRPAGLMGTRPEIQQPWQMISLDFMGPFPRSKSGHCYLLVVSDYFSKYLLMFPLRSATAKSLVKILEEQVFCVYGVPQFLICDNGQQMRSREFNHLCNQYQVQINYTANYHPQADPVERYNRVIKTMISSYVGTDHKKWDEHLAQIGCAIRTAKSEVTGFTPYFVNFGREYVAHGQEYKHRPDASVQSPDIRVQQRITGFQEIYKKIQSRIRNAQDRSRHSYNLRRRPLSFQPGQMVWKRNKVLSDAAKGIKAGLCPKYVGPYKVRKKLGSVSYELVDAQDRSLGVWHVSDLKIFTGEGIT